MKRDMDLIRRIALVVADMEFGKSLAHMRDEDVDDGTFSTHVIWMQEAGLISATVQTVMSAAPPHVRVHRLTWVGCEFVDAIRDDTLWQKARTNVLRPGMSFTFDVLKEWLKTEISQGLPTVRALGQ